MANLKSAQDEQECGGNAPNFCGEFCKSLAAHNRIFLIYKIVAFHTFYISVFVNTTAMVVGYGTKLGQVDLSSDVHPVEASGGHEGYYIWSV